MKECARIVLSIVSLLWLGTSCVQAPHTFEATWYMVKDGSENKPSMYVAIVNKSPEEQEVTGVVLNPKEGSQDSGWHLRDTVFPVKLGPGDVISRPVTSFTLYNNNTDRWECRVPVSIVVKKGENSDTAEMAGGMPSALPAMWQLGCPK